MSGQLGDWLSKKVKDYINLCHGTSKFYGYMFVFSNVVFNLIAMYLQSNSLKPVVRPLVRWSSKITFEPEGPYPSAGARKNFLVH